MHISRKYLLLMFPMLLTLPAAGQPPLPEFRVDATDGGSVLQIKNLAAQPLTAYVIELVDYPGSTFSFIQDHAVGGEPILPKAEKRIPVTNMTIGAVPEYVKLQAALFEDGSSCGDQGKVTILIERRRYLLQTTRELIDRVTKAQASSSTKAALADDLKKWGETMRPAGKSAPKTQEQINQAAGRELIANTLAFLDIRSLDEVLGKLKEAEKAYLASKPAL